MVALRSALCEPPARSARTRFPTGWLPQVTASWCRGPVLPQEQVPSGTGARLGPAHVTWAAIENRRGTGGGRSSRFDHSVARRCTRAMRFTGSTDHFARRTGLPGDRRFFGRQPPAALSTGAAQVVAGFRNISRIRAWQAVQPSPAPVVDFTSRIEARPQTATADSMVDRRTLRHRQTISSPVCCSTPADSRAVAIMRPPRPLTLPPSLDVVIENESQCQ